MSLAALLLLAQVSVGGFALEPADFLDGRAIAGGTGQPVVMLTLTPAAVAKLKPQAEVVLDGKPVKARVVDNTVEIDGQPDFAAAARLARDITGKAPLPDSMDD